MERGWPEPYGMRCRNCNRTIPTTVKFCVYCGTATPVPVAVLPAAGYVDRLRNLVAVYKVRTFVVIAAAAVGGFALVLVLAGLMSEPQTPSAADATEPTTTLTPTATALPTARSEQVAVSERESSCAPASPADVMENALPSIVQVLTNEGSGSGFIVNEAGLVVTNWHVIEESRRIYVRLHDGRELRATIADEHDRLDLAYLEVNSSAVFTPIAIGDSDAIRVGEEVIAIGFPLGSELGGDPSITQGIISAKRQGFLQTDASLNPGNSGGPLLDDLGYVVGVNTARISEADGEVITGINFAIPINDVKRNLGGLIEPGQPVCTPLATAVPPPPTSPPAATSTQAQVNTPAPVPASAVAATSAPTTSHTVESRQAATATSEPTSIPTAPPTLIPTPTHTPYPTPTPNAVPTRRPTLTPRPTATPTPTPAPTRLPLPAWRDCESIAGGSYRYSIKCNQYWTETEVVYARGRPFFSVAVQGFNREESMDNLHQRHLERLQFSAEDYAVFEHMSTRTESVEQRDYLHTEYRWQPGPADCVYDVVEHVFRSRNNPENYAFILTAGFCEDSLDPFGWQRASIMSSFVER